MNSLRNNNRGDYTSLTFRGRELTSALRHDDNSKQRYKQRISLYLCFGVIIIIISSFCRAHFHFQWLGGHCSMRFTHTQKANKHTNKGEKERESLQGGSCHSSTEIVRTTKNGVVVYFFALARAWRLTGHCNL